SCRLVRAEISATMASACVWWAIIPCMNDTSAATYWTPLAELSGRDDPGGPCANARPEEAADTTPASSPTAIRRTEVISRVALDARGQAFAPGTDGHRRCVLRRVSPSPRSTGKRCPETTP